MKQLLGYMQSLQKLQQSCEDALRSSQISAANGKKQLLAVRQDNAEIRKELVQMRTALQQSLLLSEQLYHHCEAMRVAYAQLQDEMAQFRRKR